MPTPSIRRLQPGEWRTYRDVRLLSLAESPDAFGRTLSEEKDRPDAEWCARLEASPETALPLLAEIDGEPVGLAWGKVDPTSTDTAHVHQMWVAPRHRGLGAGRMLLEGIVNWATANRLRCLMLGATCGDTPAMRLYSRAGFQPFGPPGPLRSGSSLLAQPMRLLIAERPSHDPVRE